jgi:Cd2+/Zn2+-exporting ATPase
MIKKVIMKNLICSNCAARIEKALLALPYIQSATFNFPNQVMLVDATDDWNEEIAIPEIKRIVDSIEDGVETYAYSKRHFIETKKNVEKYYTFFIGVFLYVIGYVFEYFSIAIGFVSLYWIGYAFISYKIGRKTYKGIKRGQIFDENTLMFIATIAAMILGHYWEAMLVIIFYTLGEYLQHKAVHRSKQEISSLIDLRIEYANKLVDNKIVIVDPLSIQKGDVLVVRVGERIPVDGTIIQGTSSLNTSALTGEAKLTTVKVGDYVLSGNINVGNVIQIKANKEYNNSTISKVIDLIENSTNNKARPENFITNFAKYYTPIVTLIAFLLFLIPTLINPENITDYIYSAAIILVISCPCALVLSVPLSYFAGIGASARKGILFKGSSYLHMMTTVDVIGIDKTGTLTHGDFQVTEYTNEETLKLAASIEAFSNHPIALSIVKHYTKETYTFDSESIEEIPGLGLIVTTKEGKILVGNRKLLNKHKIKVSDKKSSIGSNVYVSKNGKYIGKIVVSDTLKESSRNVIQRLALTKKIVMLTGDNKTVATYIADGLGHIESFSGLLPEEKIQVFNQLETTGRKMFVGDGINDAPLLKVADIGIALGEGSEIAVDVADVVIMGDDLSLLEEAFHISQKTKQIVYENIVFSLSIKLLFLLLAGFGKTNMLMAIFADVGITFIAVLNSLRLIYTKKK